MIFGILCIPTEGGAIQQWELTVLIINSYDLIYRLAISVWDSVSQQLEFLIFTYRIECNSCLLIILIYLLVHVQSKIRANVHLPIG